MSPLNNAMVDSDQLYICRSWSHELWVYDDPFGTRLICVGCRHMFGGGSCEGGPHCFWQNAVPRMEIGTCRIDTMALFIWLIIRLIQLIFSAGTVFSSHKKSVNSVFQPAYNSSRTGPIGRGPCWLEDKMEPSPCISRSVQLFWTSGVARFPIQCHRGKGSTVLAWHMSCDEWGVCTCHLYETARPNDCGKGVFKFAF
jgi:hypothetical protein